MSMLAERRQKQKWTLNPRGKHWSEDGNKFGQKMLEKMGWSNGKGLGANEQGMTEHVRVSVKNDKSGIGFKRDTVDEAWTEHQDSFNDFLQQLHTAPCDNIVQIEEANAELSGKSLELKSKQSRARVHYQKFTRGKDVNKYSTKDLANIFGQKEMNLNKSSKVENDSTEESTVDIQDNRGGVITINAGSMTDYFMKKDKDFSLTYKHKKRSESESEPEYAGFGFASSVNKVQYHSEENKESKNVSNYAFENPCIDLNSPEPASNTSSKVGSLKKRKSIDETELSSNHDAKKFKQDNINSSKYENGIVNDALNLDCQSDDVYNGKEFEVSRVQFGVANSALDLSDEADKKRVTFNDRVEYSDDTIKKKKGRATLDKFEVENKKAKKKKKQDTVNNSVSFGFVNEALELEDKPEEINDNEINERKNKKSKKRKESRRSNLETIVETPEEDKEILEENIESMETNENTPDNSVPEENTTRKKAKKKKKEKVKEVVDNGINIEENIENEVVMETNSQGEKGQDELHTDQENVSKEKRKKRKKTKHVESDVGHENTISETDIKDSNKTDENTEKIEEVIKIKKNKKKKKDANVNDSNMEVEIEQKEKENIDNVDENTLKATKAKKKKKHKHSIDESVTDNNNCTHNAELTEENPSSEVTNTPVKNHTNKTFKTVSSPWHEKAKMSKKILKSLFYRNSVVQFPGSNIDEIKGYGADIQ
nr:PREDICTED: G patch domain-containing protein 4 isoform X1 [Megachile rotundata]